ncbi:ABC-F family ATP-binding cassette domain-containing protein [Anaerosinus sp.]|mgnify:CR=1 FL=1|uniref:ABC-F family ATP-binding cassette domain-containing protein n=1 Tax=Selenobaculum sp. TaxID=3074374 RepID=UPI003AB2BDF6
MILSIENLTKTYGDKTLFENISFGIDEGDKIGIVGVNGTGKSTFIKTIAGLLPADSGNLIKAKTMRVGYLAQDSELDAENTILMEVFKGTDPLMQVLREYEMLLSISEKAAEDKKIQQQLLNLSQKIDELDGWQIESDAKTVLTKLGIRDYNLKAGQLSGGMAKRVALASALIQPCELLILDEPTNHLDSETICWLEEYLKKAKGALLMITHDRYFLDKVSTKILELDKGKAYTYTGNYTNFLELKMMREEQEEASERKRQNLLRTELAWMRRGAQARSTKQKARIERFEELSNRKVDIQNAKMEMSLGSTRLGKTVIELENVSYEVNGEKIINDFSYIVLRNDRVAIIGKNGSGKTTLLNLIAGKIEPTNGIIKIGQTVKIGYFCQSNVDMDERLRAIEYIREAAHFMTMADGTKLSASQLMELFLFPGNLQWTPIAKLSGGEKRRLFLLRILMSEPNVLLLDEPTNDLDIQTLAILEDFIDNFNGAILFVSHDRYFIDRLADKVFAYEENGKLTQYIGGYLDYKAILDKRAEDNKTVVNEIKTAPKEKPRMIATKRKLSFKEQKEYDEIEAVIASAEGELKAVRSQINMAGADFELLAQLTKDEEQLVKRLENLMERWAYLEEIVEGQS